MREEDDSTRRFGQRLHRSTPTAVAAVSGEGVALGSEHEGADDVLLGAQRREGPGGGLGVPGEERADEERMVELLEPYHGHRFRVIRLIWMKGAHAPRRNQRESHRDTESQRRDE